MCHVFCNKMFYFTNICKHMRVRKTQSHESPKSFDVVKFNVRLFRKHLLKKRMSKGPYKIILTTSDFVFPQVPPVDSRTVSGISFDRRCEFLTLLIL